MSSRALATALVSLLLATGASGCAGFSNYMSNRAKDFQDIWHVAGGYGPGVDLNIMATRYLQAGAGYYECRYKDGFVGRKAGTWREERYDGSLLVGVGDTIITPETGEIQDMNETHSLDWRWSMADKNRRPWEFGFLVHLVYVNFEFGLDVSEFLDFLGGIVGIDAKGDDRPAP